MQNSIFRWVCSVWAMLLLAACGGGGAAGTYYPFVGGSCEPGLVGIPFSCTPNIGGLPPGSTLNLTASNLPPGLTVQANTGLISGTPTASGRYSIVFQMTASGASGVLNFPYEISIGTIPSDVWRKVASATPFPSFASQAAGVLGSDIYVVGAREDNLSIETWRSSDNAVSWTKLLVSPPVALKDFALSSDGARLLLTGGRDNSNSNYSGVYSFDGASWQTVTSVGQTYSARWGHSMSFWNGAWWIVGGTEGGSAGANAKADVWKSLDNGASWTLINADLGSAGSFPSAARTYGHCTQVVGSMLVKVGGSSATNGQTEDLSQALLGRGPWIWKSSDGINWSSSIANTQQEFTYAGCASVNGLFHYVGGTRINLNDSPLVRDQGFYSGIAMYVWTYDGNANAELVNSPVSGLPNQDPLAQRFAMATAVIGDKLFVIGGRSSNLPTAHFSDVWVSTR